MGRFISWLVLNMPPLRARPLILYAFIVALAFASGFFWYEKYRRIG
jgi:hypothetical protein